MTARVKRGIISGLSFAAILDQAVAEKWQDLVLVSPSVEQWLVPGHQHIFAVEAIPSQALQQFQQLATLQALAIVDLQLGDREAGTIAAYLPRLRSLDLDGNRLTSIPAEIIQLTDLTQLNLSDNQLTALPADFARLANLSRLNFSGNQLTALPADFARLANLSTLFLQGNQLTALPADFARLANLSALDLSGNQLTALPADFARLAKLSWLDLSGNHLTALPADFARLAKLSWLYLHGNQLTALPADFARLANLSHLYLSGNQLTALPADFARLANLSTLYLRDNQLTALPADFARLAKLFTLDLRGNRLTALPADFARLAKLSRLDLDNNPSLRFPPKAIVAQGTQAILSFLREHLAGQRQEWRSKVILVGEGRAGKTSLLRQLLVERHDVSEPTTHGLQVRGLDMAHPDNRETMHLNVWDFGGQHILHATHQFFLTQRSLYVLVWNAGLGHQQGKLHYWLDMIRARDPEAPILIVAAHAEDWQPDFPYEELTRQYPAIKGRFAISNRYREKTAASFAAFQEAVRSLAAALPLMGATWPKSWLDTADWVRAQEAHTLSPTRLYQAMEEFCVQNEETLADYLHNLGDILFFRDKPDLDDLVILDAPWVTRHISLMLASDKIESGPALFTRQMMKEIWCDVDEHVRDLFLRLMEQFDLSYRIEHEEDISLVVEKLSESAADYRPAWDARKGEREVAMIYRLTTSLPPGIPTWFIARSHRFTTHTHWRYGALFADTPDRDHLALLRASDHDRYVELRVRGPEPVNFFALLRDGLELTLRRYEGLAVTRMVPCICQPGCPHEFPYDNLRRRLAARQNKAECDESFEQIDVKQLLYGFEPSVVEQVLEKLDRQERQNRELRNYIQREFTKQLRIEQAKLGASWPSLFLAWPEDQNLLTRLNQLGGKTLCVQLICEAPGCWHHPQNGGCYTIKFLPGWQRSLQPAFEKMVVGLKMFAPTLTAGIGLKIPDLEKRFKFMEELTKTLPGQERWAETPPNQERGADGDPAAEGDPQANSFLREVLTGKDPKTYGLRKILTAEGHVYWVCDAHHQQYQKTETFHPL